MVRYKPTPFIGVFQLQDALDEGAAKGWRLAAVTEERLAFRLFWEVPDEGGPGA